MAIIGEILLGLGWIVIVMAVIWRAQDEEDGADDEPC